MKNILIITQDEPFFLYESLGYFFKNLDTSRYYCVCCTLPASPFGKSESTLRKAQRTLQIFGLKFFIFYSLKFIYRKYFSKKTLCNVLKKHNIINVDIEGDINQKSNIDILKGLRPDLIVSILGNQIFKSPLLELAPCLNLHTAPLPKYRGLLPTFWVLKNQEKQTAVSVFLVDEGIDSGPILVQSVVQLGNKSQLELIRETKIIGMKDMLRSIDMVMSGNYQTISNNDDFATYYSFPTRKDVIEFLRKKKRFF